MKLLAILSTGLFLIMICLMLLGQFFEVKTRKRTYSIGAVLFIVMIMFMAYGSYFGKGSDLKRYYEIMDGMKGKSFAWAQENGQYRNTLIANFLFWIIAQIGDYQLLPMITAGITAFNISYIVVAESKRRNLSSRVVCVYLLQIVAVATIALILTAVRQNVMASLFAVAVYRDFIQKKKNIWTILLYLSTCMVHVAAIFLIVVRLCACVKSNVKYCFLGWCILIPLAEKISGDSGIIEEAVGKLFVYKDITDVDIRSVLAQAALLCVMAFRIWDMKILNKRGMLLQVNERYLNFLETFLIFSIGAIPVLHLFLRQITVLTYITLPLLMDFKEADKKNSWIYSVLVSTFICLGLFAYQAVFAVNFWEFL